MEIHENNPDNTQANRGQSKDRQTDQPSDEQPQNGKGDELESNDDNPDDGSGTTAREP